MLMTMVVTDKKTGEIYFADFFDEVVDAIERITGDTELAENVAYWFEDGDFSVEAPSDSRFHIELEPAEPLSMKEYYWG